MLCRATSAGFGDYVDCLTQGAHLCRHALQLGGGYLCLHPERQKIVEETKANPGPTDKGAAD